MWNHDVWGESTSLKSPSLTFHQVIFESSASLHRPHIYTDINPDCSALIKNQPLQQTKYTNSLQKASDWNPTSAWGSMQLCMCVGQGGGGRGCGSQEWPCVFDGSVFVDDLSPFLPPSVVWSAWHRRQLPLTNTQHERCLPLGGWERLCVCMGGSAGEKRGRVLKMLAGTV